MTFYIPPKPTSNYKTPYIPPNIYPTTQLLSFHPNLYSTTMYRHYKFTLALKGSDTKPYTDLSTYSASPNECSPLINTILNYSTIQYNTEKRMNHVKLFKLTIYSLLLFITA